jgi:hypothetical protein
MNRKLENVIGLLINIPMLGYYRMVTVECHHEMVDGFCEHVFKASFAEFRRDFEKVEWETDYRFRGSLFMRENDCEFHASIICINGIGYKLTTYGLIRANILRRRKIRELNLEYIRQHRTTQSR